VPLNNATNNAVSQNGYLGHLHQISQQPTNNNSNQNYPLNSGITSLDSNNTGKTSHTNEIYPTKVTTGAVLGNLTSSLNNGVYTNQN